MACEVSDYAPLKDCTSYGAHPGRNHFRIGGRRGITGWVPLNAYKNTLESDRTSLFSYIYVLIFFQKLINNQHLKIDLSNLRKDALILFSCSNTTADPDKSKCDKLDYQVCSTSGSQRL